MTLQYIPNVLVSLVPCNESSKTFLPLARLADYYFSEHVAGLTISRLTKVAILLLDLVFLSPMLSVFATFFYWL